MSSIILNALKEGLTYDAFMSTSAQLAAMLTPTDFSSLLLHFAQGQSKPVQSVSVEPAVSKSSLELNYIQGIQRAWIVENGTVSSKAVKRAYYRVHKHYNDLGKFQIGQGKLAKTTTDKVAMVAWLSGEAAKGSYVVVFKPSAGRWNAYEMVAKAAATHYFDFEQNRAYALAK